ncbi:zinc-binding protein [Candidatus Shapirobacteria bacterium]|nr:zinc-binding protein [Candidatus Shapirobacteria bacterium]
MKKILFLVGVIAIIGLGLYAALNIAPKTKTDSQKITIVTTLFPLYDFAKNIGQDRAEVSLLLPPGVEAHTFEPRPSDITRINNANIFVYTGEFMEPWAHDIIEGADKKVKIVDASANIETRVDPHIWLDFDNAKVMAGNIAKTLSAIDPQNAEYYQNNLRSYQSKLAELDNSYKNALTSCQTKIIVYGGHYAFSYMGKRYGLAYESAYGISPDSEPSAQDLAGLIKQIKTKKIGYVFFEELVSPKVAQTLAKETGAGLLLLNPAHNLTKDEFEKNESFLSIMEKNLSNLKIGLFCNK